jgi:hypothetical protein
MSENNVAVAVVAKVKPTLSDVSDAAMNLFIANNEDYVMAGELLKKVKAASKNFKAEKDRVLKPVKDLVKSYEATLKPTADQLADLEKLLKGKMLSYNEEQSAIAAKQSEALDRKIESGYIKSPETMMKNMAAIETPDNANAGVTESMVKKVKLVDIRLIPAEYFARPKVVEALMVELRKDALGNKAQNIAPIDIPGVEVYEEKSLSV